MHGGFFDIFFREYLENIPYAKKKKKKVVPDLRKLGPVSSSPIMSQTMGITKIDRQFWSISKTWRWKKKGDNMLKINVNFYLSKEHGLQWYAHRAEFTLNKFEWNYIIQRLWYSEG